MKIIIPQVNFGGFNTNLVPVCLCCISSFFVYKTRLERYTFTLDKKKLMFMVVFNEGNYLKRTITLVLNFCMTSKDPLKTIREKKKDKKTKKTKNRRAARPKVTIPRRESTVLLYFTLRVCANSVH